MEKIKDITESLEQRSASDYLMAPDVIASLADSLFALTVKDLYNVSYDLKEALQPNSKVSKRKITSLKRSLSEIMAYFDSPLYLFRCKTPKSVWIEWAEKAITEPRRRDIGLIIDIAYGRKIVDISKQTTLQRQANA